MPANAKFWFVSQNDRDLHEAILSGAEDTSLTLEVSTIRVGSGGRIRVFDPGRALDPGGSYELHVFSENATEPDERFFFGGAERDEVPPPLPEVLRHTTDHAPAAFSCAADRWMEITFADENEGLIVVDVDEDESLFPSELRGGVTAAAIGQSVELGYGGCVEGWPHGERTATLRFGAFDVAGNFSGWTEPEAFDIGGCGCSTRSGRPSLAFLCVVFVCMFVSRRDRRRR